MYNSNCWPSRLLLRSDGGRLGKRLDEELSEFNTFNSAKLLNLPVGPTEKSRLFEPAVRSTAVGPTSWIV